MEIMRFKNPDTNVVFEQVNFDSFKKLMYDAGIGKEKNVTKEEANKKIREIFYKVNRIDSNTPMRDVRKALRRNQAQNFEIIEEVVPDLLVTGIQGNEFWNEYVEYRNGNAGDQNQFRVEDDVILTVSELSGNHWDLVRQRLGGGETFTVKTSWFGLAIYAEFERFMTGYVDWAEFVQKIYEAMDKKLNAMIYQAFMAAGDKVLPENRFNKELEFVEADRKKIVKLAQDISSLTGEEVVFAGTRVALDRLNDIVPIDFYSDAMKDERNTTGRLGRWQGFETLEIPVIFDQGSVDKELTDDNKILILPKGENKFIKVFDEGDAYVKDVSDGTTNLDMTIEYKYLQKLGVATVINKKFGQLKYVEGD
jgi:hypothetical protein